MFKTVAVLILLPAEKGKFERWDYLEMKALFDILSSHLDGVCGRAPNLLDLRTLPAGSPQ